MAWNCHRSFAGANTRHLAPFFNGRLRLSTAIPAVATITLLMAAMPLSAQPFTRTIANGETVVVQRNESFGVLANESLLIQSGGELQGRGSLIGLAGLVQNNGLLRAFKGSENATAVDISGPFTNSGFGRIEVTHLTVSSGGVLMSEGGLQLGGFRVNPGDPLVLVCANTVPCPETGFTIDSGGRIEVGVVGGMLNHGDGQILGSLENAGSFVSRNGANTSGGIPYSQTLTVGRDPVFGGGQGRVLNVGHFELQRGNTLRNYDRVSNSGSFELAGGRYMASDEARLVNTGTVVVGSGGQLIANRTPGFDAQGDRLVAVFNSGRVEVQAGATLHNGWFMRVEPLGPALAEVVVAQGGTLTQSDDGLMAIAGGIMQVGGSVTGGAITVGNLGGIAGALRIDPGGSVSVDSYLQTEGELRVNGTLTGQVTLLGGNLTGGVLGSSINGNTLVGGAGGGPAQEPPNCGNAFFACFRPGNSPGHMDIFGDLTMGANSILELEIERDANGVLTWDSVFAESMSFESGSTIRVLVGAGVPGAAVVDLELLRCGAGGCDFGPAQFVVLGGAGGEFSVGSEGLHFAVAAAPVPEPGTWAMWAIGLAALTGSQWRRRRAGYLPASRTRNIAGSWQART